MSLTDLTLRIHVGERVHEANFRQEYSMMGIIIPQTLRYQAFGNILILFHIQLFWRSQSSWLCACRYLFFYLCSLCSKTSYVSLPFFLLPMSPYFHFLQFTFSHKLSVPKPNNRNSVTGYAVILNEAAGGPLAVLSSSAIRKCADSET